MIIKDLCGRYFTYYFGEYLRDILSKINKIEGVKMSIDWWKLGKYLYSIPLTLTGVIYLWQPQASVETLTSFIPGGLTLIYAAGVLWVLLGILVFFDIQLRYATWGIIGLLTAYQIMVHVPAIYTGEYLAVVWFELLRDLSLIGGAFFILALEDKGHHSRAIKTIKGHNLTMH